MCFTGSCCSYGSALMGRCVALVSMSIKLYLYSSNLYVYYQQLFNTYTLIFNGSTVNTLETLQHTEKKSCGSCTSENSYKATLFVTSYKGVIVGQCSCIGRGSVVRSVVALVVALVGHWWHWVNWSRLYWSHWVTNEGHKKRTN